MSMFSGFNLPAGFNLGSLAGLLGGGSSMNPGQSYQQMMRTNPYQSSQAAREASGLNAASAQYQQELKRLQDEAARASRTMLAGAPKGYTSKYVGDVMSGTEKAALFDLMGRRAGGMDFGLSRVGGAARGSQYWQDMLPFVDRYNQLRDQYRGMGVGV
jgi:hypothetical protein